MALPARGGDFDRLVERNMRFGLLDVKRILLFQDGCDYYGSDPGLKWTASNGSMVDLSGVNSRTGIGAIACSGSVAPTQSIPESSDLFIGIACKNQSLAFAGSPLRLLNSGGTSITMTITINSDGSVSIIQGPFGPTLATSLGGLVNSNQYAYFELQFSSTQQKCSLRINGQVVIPLTAFTIGLPNCDAVTMIGAHGGQTMWIDDVYILNNMPSGDPANPNDTFLGPVRLYPGVPIADSTPLQFTPSAGTTHFSLVDAIPPNGGTAYVFSNTPGQIDQYIFGVPAGITPPVKIFGFCVSLLSEIDSAGSRTLAAQIGSTQGAAQALTTVYHIVSTEFDVNPITGVALLLTDLASMPTGPVVVS